MFWRLQSRLIRIRSMLNSCSKQALLGDDLPSMGASRALVQAYEQARSTGVVMFVEFLNRSCHHVPHFACQFCNLIFRVKASIRFPKHNPTSQRATSLWQKGCNTDACAIFHHGVPVGPCSHCNRPCMYITNLYKSDIWWIQMTRTWKAFSDCGRYSQHYRMLMIVRGLIPQDCLLSLVEGLCGQIVESMVHGF